MESGAVEGLFQSVFEGCISMMDMEIERRPYHRDCSCALHNRGGFGFTKACSLCGKVSFPIQRSWSDSSLFSSSSSSSSSKASSPSYSPAHGASLFRAGSNIEFDD